MVANSSASSNNLPCRVRVNIARTTKGNVSYEATVELTMPLGTPSRVSALQKRMRELVLASSDELNAELQRRYPVEGLRGT